MSSLQCGYNTATNLHRMGFVLLLGLCDVSRMCSVVQCSLTRLAEFVAMPLGHGYTIENQVTGREVCQIAGCSWHRNHCSRTHALCAGCWWDAD